MSTIFSSLVTLTSFAIQHDPRSVEDLEELKIVFGDLNLLLKMEKMGIKWRLQKRPERSLCHILRIGEAAMGKHHLSIYLGDANRLQAFGGHYVAGRLYRLYPVTTFLFLRTKLQQVGAGSGDSLWRCSTRLPTMLVLPPIPSAH